MLNITVAGTALSTYYLADPGLFLREHRDQVIGAEAAEGIRVTRRELRRLMADIDETTTLGVARSRLLDWLGCFGWRFPTLPQTLDEPVVGRCGDGAGGSGPSCAWVLVTPTGQHLDTSPTGRRAGRLRPQRQAETVVRSGRLPAVLLCNGAELRVIRRDPGLGGEASYLAVDLAGLAELGDDHEWRVLWALLAPEAFLPDREGRNLWDRAEQASTDTADTVSANLSGGVRSAIRAVADGALADLRRRGHAPPAPRELFRDALTVAYRLLFVAYAEDRGLLPVGTPAYDDGYSLRMVRDLVADPTMVWPPDGGYLWCTLRAQWALLRDGVNAGDLQVSGFDGGLFSPDKCPLLDDPEMTVGDRYVRDLVDALSWTEPVRGVRRNQQVGRRRINYRELGVEQLGSIYEGLLAFEPQIADASKALVRVGTGQQTRQQVVPTGQVPPGAVVVEEYPTGSFYLFEATGQRKGSGSYYTPRPLAHFVVGEALRPLVQAATPEQILRLRVCDPAMGSGAFLVPAVHFLTEAYGEALARAGQDIGHTLDDTERARYRRLIVERCIYGVDLNPMAVELAKVSLWLTTASAGKPLSFLDAHLRCGNSVVGADITTWEGVPEPAITKGRRAEPDSTDDPMLFDLDPPDLTGVLRERRRLAEAPSDDRLQVRGKEEAFARLLDGTDWTRLRALGDWWVAPFFHTELHGYTGRWVVGRATIIRGQQLPDELNTPLRDTRETVRPFHWQIEFPEVFFDESGRRRPDAGFDAMIGNPPWEGITFKAAEFYGRFDPSYTWIKGNTEKDRRKKLLDQRPDVAAAKNQADRHLSGTKSFIKSSGAYRMLYWHGAPFNYYRTFLERELSLLAPGGRLGLVIDSGVLADAATAEHRRELLDHYTVDRFVLCDNTEKIFPIDSREQFVLLVAGRGGQTDPFRLTTGVTRLEHLLELDELTITIPRSTITALAPDTLAIPDTRDAALLDLLGVIYGNHPLLLDGMPVGGWRIDWGREFNIKDDARYFASDATGLPLREGKHIHQYVHDFAEPTYRLKEGIGEKALVERARKRAKKKDIRSLKRRPGEHPLYAPEPRMGVLELPADHYRPCLREVARATDERTLIAAVLPPGTVVGHSLHFFYRSTFDQKAHGYRTVLGTRAMVYVVALLNGLVLDFVVRRKVGAHLTKSVMATLPVADVPLDHGPGMEIVRLSGRLTCRSREFDELAEVLGVECAPLTAGEERALRAELDARVARLYGLSAAHLELVLADFGRSASGEGSPVRPDDVYKDLVRTWFARLGE